MAVNIKAVIDGKQKAVEYNSGLIPANDPEKEQIQYKFSGREREGERGCIHRIQYKSV